MNKVFLIGRLTKDPEMRYTSTSGVAVTTFTLAVDRPYRNRNGEREADFIPVVVWRKLAETCASNLMKGRLVAVSGRLQVRVYETQKKKRYVTEVVAEEVRFLDKPPVGEASEEGLEDVEIPELEIEGLEEDGDENPF